MARREQIIIELEETIRHLYNLKKHLLGDGEENINQMKETIRNLDHLKKCLLSEREEMVDWELVVTDILYEIEIPTHTVGYQYVREAIILVAQDVKYLTKLKKNLYFKLAEKYKTTPAKVEAGIKNLIQMAWKKGCFDNIDKIFCDFVPGKKPTIKQFIASISDYVRLDVVY